jgi:hypothetical protein
MGLAAPARADDESEARLHFEIGRGLYEDFKLDEALQHFIAAHKLVPRNKLTVHAIVQTYELKLEREGKARRKAGAAAPASRNALDAWNWLRVYLAFDALTPEERAEGERHQAALAPRVAVVDVVTQPAGAEVVLDGESLARGVTPLAMAVMPGEHVVRLALAGHRGAEGPVVAAMGQRTAVKLDLVRLEGELRVQSTPPGARVLLEPQGIELGVTPLALTLPVGTMRVRVTAPGFIDQARDVALADGAAQEVAFALQRAAATVATLSVNGAPQGAVVRLEGRELGRVPLSVGELPPGPGTIEIAAEGHDAWRGPVLLEAGAATRVEANLVVEHKPAWAGWKWVGYGGGAALFLAGAAVGLDARLTRDDFDQHPTGAAYDDVGTKNVVADVLMLSGLVVAAATATIRALSHPPSSTAKVAIER